MAVIRTQRFAVGAVPAGNAPLNAPSFLRDTPESRETADYVYTVPPDRRAVVRHVDLWIVSPTIPPDIFPETYLGFVSWAMYLTDGQFIVICNLSCTTVHTGRQWQGTAVMHPGDQLYVTSSKSDSGLHYQISGAELVIQ